MKKFYLLFLFFFGFFSVYSQTPIALTFMGKDSVSQNHISWNSVLVENLTRSCDTLISWPDSVLSIIAVGIDQLQVDGAEEFILKQNYPNPFLGSTLVSVYRKYSGHLNLVLFDVSGTKLAEYQNDFGKGFLSFIVSASGNKVLNLAAFDDKNNRSMKMISAGNGEGSNSIKYLGNVPNGDKGGLKRLNNSGFIFNLGDQLKYTMSAYGYMDNTKSGSPSSDTSYTFNMAPVPLILTVSTSPVTNITQTTATSGGTVMSEGGAPVTSRGVCWSTSPAPTTADNHTTDGSGIGVFVSNLTGLTGGTLYYIRAYAINSLCTSYGNELTFQTLALSYTCGSSFTLNHIAGAVSPVSKTVIYGTVTNIPGETSKCWITSNLGSDHQAIAVSDTSEASAGWYWQFDRKQGYMHTGTIRTPATVWISSIIENTDWVAAQDPCALSFGSGWRVPSKTEWTNVYTIGSWTNWTGPWNSALKLHAAGHLSGNNGSLSGRGTFGYYWSNTQNTAARAWYLYFSNGPSNIYEDYKALGFTLRCINNSLYLTLPTVTTTVVTNTGQTTATSGGNVTADGGATVTARGVCWSNSPTPTTAGSYTIDGSGTGNFISYLTGLTPNTAYYLRAYAINSVGTVYGNELIFTTLP